jgi:glutamate synthase (NADPH/NADH) small chain
MADADFPTSKAERRKIPRQRMPEQDPQTRRKNFDEVNLGYTPQMARLEALRCLQCKKPKCVLGCPVRVVIPEFIKHIADGEFMQAAEVIKQANALPAVTGRVCPQEDQCEKHCVIGLKGEPVAIGKLERFAADYERAHRTDEPPEKEPPTSRKIAIVGAGPAGLTAARDLARWGHEVVVFEALHAPGGVLFYGIPQFRLPKEIVEAEIHDLEQLGVEIKTDYVIGRTRSIDELLGEEGFDAVFIGTGAGLPYFLGIPGEALNGVYSANEVLTRVNLMHAWQFPEYDTPLHKHRHVAVIGGGNTAMDAARTALRLPSVEKVTLIYRRTRDELPAREEEVEHAEAEGIEFKFLASPVRILDQDGWVGGLECQLMQLGEPDASGRRRPVPMDGKNFVLDVDAVIIAIGSGSNPLLTQDTPDLKTDEHGHIETVGEDAVQTKKEGVFAGGDIVTGAATVIEAMGAGKRAAVALHNYVMARPPHHKPQG